MSGIGESKSAFYQKGVNCFQRLFIAHTFLNPYLYSPEKMQEAEGVTEDAKMTEPTEWVRKMNSIRNQAEEIILVEMIYT